MIVRSLLALASFAALLSVMACSSGPSAADLCTQTDVCGHTPTADEAASCKSQAEQCSSEADDLASCSDGNTECVDGSPTLKEGKCTSEFAAVFACALSKQ